VIQVYIHMPKTEALNYASGGIKLSEKKEREFSLNGIKYNCFFGWLHPNDDAAQKRSDDTVCVRINVDARYCFVEDLDLPNGESIKPFSNYQLGEYRRPRCLVCCTVLPSRIKLQGRRLDEPILYENSKELYLETLQAELEGNHPNFRNDSLCGFFELLHRQGEFEKIENAETIIYKSKGRHYTFEKRC